MRTLFRELRKAILSHRRRRVDPVCPVDMSFHIYMSTYFCISQNPCGAYRGKYPFINLVDPVDVGTEIATAQRDPMFKLKFTEFSLISDSLCAMSPETRSRGVKWSATPNM